MLFLIFLLPFVQPWNKKMENPNLFEGDMVLRPDQIQKWKDGTLGYGSKKNKNELWPNGVVPYKISYELRNKREAMNSINAAFEEYKKYTCIRFKPRTNEPQYVEFHKGGGCSSWVGRDVYVRGGRHPISLDDGCWFKTTVMHEIAHSLGFYHEQSRPDRDSYIDVLFNNMPSGAASQFKKQTYATVDSLGTPYDYASMMHYNWNAFGHYRNGADFALQTIRTKDPSKQWLLGQRDGFSRTDVIQINKLYSCPGTYKLPPRMATLPTDACHDKGGSCADGKLKGQCTSRQWQSWNNKACRFTCGICKGRPNPEGTGEVVPTGGPVTNNPPTRPPPPGDCTDTDQRCSFWASNGYCPQSNVKEASYREIMNRKCCKSCKENAQCRDRNSRCQEWTNRGECNANPKYMNEWCRQACKLCS